jgi:hypothetical protein
MASNGFDAGLLIHQLSNQIQDERLYQWVRIWSFEKGYM